MSLYNENIEDNKSVGSNLWPNWKKIWKSRKQYERKKLKKKNQKNWNNQEGELD